MGAVTLHQLEDAEGRAYLPRDGDTLQSPAGTYRARRKPEYGDWVELRVSSGELPKQYLETV